MSIKIGKRRNKSADGMMSLTSNSKSGLPVVAAIAKPTVDVIKKIPREAERILDQALDVGNNLAHKIGLDRIMPSNSHVGVSATSNGSANMHFQPNNNAPSVGIGINNNGTPSVFVNNQVAMTFENKPIDYAEISRNSKIYVPSGATEHVITQMPGVDFNVITENNTCPQNYNNNDFKSNQQPLNVKQLDGGVSFSTNVQSQQKQVYASAFNSGAKHDSKLTDFSKDYYQKTPQSSQPVQPSLLKKALDSIADIAVTVFTGSSAAHANPAVIAGGSVVGAAVVPGAISATSLPGKPPNFTWGQLKQELRDVANKMVISPLRLAVHIKQVLTTPIHGTKPEDITFPGGGKVDIDTSIPPSVAQDKDNKLHNIGNTGNTAPKPKDLSIPGYVAYDGEPVLFMFKDSKNSGNNREHAPDPDKRYIPAPKSLNGFPDAIRAEPKNNRARWQLPDKRILEWDKQHGEIEMYDRRGNHLGAYDPITGNKIKAPVVGRKIEV